MTTAKMTLVSTVLAAAFGLALGLMSTPAQAHCKRNHQLPHEHCTPSDGTTYTVQLIDGDSLVDGAFCLDVFGGLPICGPADVIAASDGALLVGDSTGGDDGSINYKVLELIRPSDKSVLDATWDGVLNTCPGLFEFDGVNKLFVDNWRVNSQSDRVSIQFIRASTFDSIGGVEVEVKLMLIDVGPFDFDVDPFLPAAGSSITYDLDNYSIVGQSVRGTNPRLRCDNTGDTVLFRGIDLVITAAPAP